jgi:pimeloyl-ACP methyl ester carboxylesterase
LSDGDGMQLLVVNGIGANLAPWRKPLIDVVRERTVVTWDHRGLHASPLPASERRDAGAHAEDALAVLDHFDIEKTAVVSWSNGARIALELANRAPERVGPMVLVCGSFTQGVYDLVRHLEPAPLVSLFTTVAKHFSNRLEAPLRRLVERPEITGLIRQSGLVGAEADTRGLIELLQGLAACDLRTLLASYEAVTTDPPGDVMSSVESPVLLIAGAHDRFAPVRVAEEMAAALPDSRLEVYPRATHYLPLEYPAKLSGDLRRFLAENGV